VGNYAVFAGGGLASGGTKYSAVDAYDSALVRYTPSPLSEKKSGVKGASVGNYAVFIGYTDSKKSTVSAYNSALVLTNPTYQIIGSSYEGASANNYAVFCSGSIGDVFAIDSALVFSTLPKIKNARNFIAGASVGNYALFAGGSPGSSGLSDVDIYKGLTKITNQTLSMAMHYPEGVTAKEHAFFGITECVDAFNSSLQRFTFDGFSVDRIYAATAAVGNHALFAGGERSVGKYVSAVDAYSI
jgi:hypothetical protein